MSLLAKKLGARLSSERAEQGIPQQDIAARVGITPSTLSLIESGKRLPSVPVLLALRAALGNPAWSLLLNDLVALRRTKPTPAPRVKPRP